MAPKAGKAKPPVLDAAECQKVADELGIVGDYKQYNAGKENLTRPEELAAAKCKLEEYNAAKEHGAPEEDANLAADAAFTRAVFKFKLQRGYSKYVKKNSGAASEVVAPPPPAASPAAAPVADPDADENIELRTTKTILYQEEIQAAYNRILTHRIFKDMVMLPPNPIQKEDAGDSGMQDLKPNSNLMYFRSRLFPDLLTSTG